MFRSGGYIGEKWRSVQLPVSRISNWLGEKVCKEKKIEKRGEMVVNRDNEVGPFIVKKVGPVGPRNWYDMYPPNSKKGDPRRNTTNIRKKSEDRDT